MNIQTLLSLVQRNRFLLIALGLLLPSLLVLYLLLLPSPSDKNLKGQSPIPTSAPESNMSVSSTISGKSILDEQAPFNEKELQGVQKKESLSDGSVQYTYASENPERPNIILVKDSKPLYNRIVSNKDSQTIIDTYVKKIGDPSYISHGSSFYGETKVTYIYPERGIAFVADLPSGYIYEQHFFLPMPAIEYKNTYGDDITGEFPEREYQEEYFGE